MKLFDKSYDVLEKKLDLEFKRHVVLSGNVANSETPGFRARELDFSGELEQAMGNAPDALEKTNAKHLDITGAGTAHTIIDQNAEVGADGNSVDVDIEMGKLMTNARGYGQTLELLGTKLRLLKMVVSGRGGI